MIFHAVAKRRRNAFEHVAGRDEHDVREIERDVQVMVAEREVLFRIQDFEKRRDGIAAEIATEFVDLVENEDRIVGTGLFHALDDAAGKSADVSAAMSADFRFVFHAAEGDRERIRGRELVRSSDRSSFYRPPEGRRSRGSDLSSCLSTCEPRDTR